MDTAAASLHLDYLPAEALALRPVSWWDCVLGVVGFGELPRIEAPRVPVTASMTPLLGGGETLCEVWRVTGSRGATLKSGSDKHRRIQYRFSDDLLFGSIIIDERQIDDSAAPALLSATLQAYEDIFALLKQTPNLHLVRVWNYLPDINRADGGDERYRHFNSARQTAFRNSGRSTTGTVPAASALGSPAGSPVSIYFLASSEPPKMIENPRQTSAYFYPPKFGTHSPTFSRACLLSESTGTNLFVSGTASIVGHETIHRGDVSAQTRESLANIDALLAEANRLTEPGRFSLDDLKFKVYVRQPSDLAAIEAALAVTLHAATPVLYLHADVCREDLLVEIEATGTSRDSPGE